MSADSPVVRRLNQVAGAATSPGATVREMLNDDHGCRGLHQRRLGLAAEARLAGTVGGQGEAWYVITGTGSLGTERAGSAALAPGTGARCCHESAHVGKKSACRSSSAQPKRSFRTNAGHLWQSAWEQFIRVPFANPDCPRP